MNKQKQTLLQNQEKWILQDINYQIEQDELEKNYKLTKKIERVAKRIPEYPSKIAFQLASKIVQLRYMSRVNGYIRKIRNILDYGLNGTVQGQRITNIKRFLNSDFTLANKGFKKMVNDKNKMNDYLKENESEPLKQITELSKKADR